MGLHKNTGLRHLSYSELDSMLRTLAEQMLSAGIKEPLVAVDRDNKIITYLLSEFTGLPVANGINSLRVGLTSELDTDICIFKKNYNSEHYNRTVKFYCEDLYQEEDESFPKVTLPWRK